MITLKCRIKFSKEFAASVVIITNALHGTIKN